ncbi:serine/threonine-protein kinase [Tahibacter amnicola]|uniref:Serine/threonine protein kinase n=1 Tax=Tahibacter amnicola TaxID=2976241 RepID=A0ABY6BET0_9GAMM|nr:serine/threonine-protein kinase [Tahibacter amnicola]UXI68282.1 serine/threonine protein kinase [Tahibacter amnicola]
MNDTDAYLRQKNAFFDLLDLPPDDRVGYLAQLAATDPSLADVLARQLESAGQPLPALDACGREPALPRVASYRLERELGRGGMGRVWLAERSLGDARQRVALKQLLHSAWTDEARRRFERERRILAGLLHPNIAALVDAGTDADGAPYLATTYVDGERIDRYCATTGASVIQRVQLIRQVAEAVAYAHRKLVVHRDIKPANILVDRDGRPQLLDFGIARFLVEEAITTDGVGPLTLRYAAPEQLSPEGQDAGVACDVYALGAVLYELLTGASPHGDVDDPKALISAILTREAEAPSRLSRLRGVDADLDAICAMALRKRPEERYASAGALAADLARWLARQAVDARRGERGYRAKAWLRRRWPVVLGIVAMSTFAIFHIVQQDRLLERTRREHEKTKAVANYLVTLFRVATPNKTSSGDVSVREMLDQGTRSLQDKLARGGDARSLVPLLLAVARVHCELGDHPKARDLSTRAAQAAGDQGDVMAQADALRSVAGESYHLDDPKAFHAHTQEGVKLLESIGETDSDLYLAQIGNLAIGYYLIGEAEKSWPIFERVHRLNEYTNMERYILGLNNAAGLALNAGECQRGENWLRMAQEATPRRRAPNPAEDILIGRNLAWAALCNERPDEARERIDAQMAKGETFWGKAHPELASLYNDRAEIALAQGDLATAAAAADAAYTLASKGLPPGHGITTDAQGLIGIIQVEKGDYAQALPQLEAVVAARGSGAPVEPQPHVEQVALERARCALRQTPLRERAQLEPHLTARNLAPWQRRLVTRWLAGCSATTAR